MKTTNEIAGFTNGQTLKTDDEIDAYFRAVLNEGEKPEDFTKLSKVELVAIAKGVKAKGLTDEEVNQRRVRALMDAKPQLLQVAEGTAGIENKPEPKPLPASAASKVSAAAQQTRLAAEIGESLGEEFSEDINRAVNGKRDWDGAPVMVEMDLRAKYGLKRNAEGKVTQEDQILLWPRPGTRETGKSANVLPKGSNERADYYVVPDSATGKDRTEQFYRNAFLSSKAGIAMFTPLRQLNAASAGVAEKGTPSWILKMVEESVSNPIPLQDKKKELTKDIDDATQRFRRAVEFHQAVGRLERSCKKIRWKFVNAGPAQWGFNMTDRKMLLEAAKKPLPIQFIDVNNPEAAIVSKAVSVAQFIGLDYEECAAKGGTTAILLAARKRERDDPANAGGTTEPGKTAPEITTKLEFRDRLYAIGNYVDEKDRFASVLLECQKDDDLCLAIHKVAEFCDGIMPKIQNKVNVLVANRTAANDAKLNQTKGKQPEQAAAQG